MCVHQAQREWRNALPIVFSHVPTQPNVLDSFLCHESTEQDHTEPKTHQDKLTTGVSEARTLLNLIVCGVCQHCTYQFQSQVACIHSCICLLPCLLH